MFYRCTLPGWEDNDTYAIQDGLHNVSVQQWIPLDKEGRMLTCNISSSLNSTDTEICSQWVFDKSSYRGTTLNMNVSALHLISSGVMCNLSDVCLMSV